MPQVARSIVGYIPAHPGPAGPPARPPPRGGGTCPAAAPRPPSPSPPSPAPGGLSGGGGAGWDGDGGGGTGVSAAGAAPRSPGEGDEGGGAAAQPPPPRSPGARWGAMLRCAPRRGMLRAARTKGAGNGCSKCTSAALRRPLRTAAAAAAAAGGAPAPAAGKGLEPYGRLLPPGQSGGCAAGPGAASRIPHPASRPVPRRGRRWGGRKATSPPPGARRGQGRGPPGA